jgi:hypothetical protein
MAPIASAQDVRSQTGDRLKRGNPREQTNELTSYLDGSVIYVSDETRAAALRTFSGGELATSAGGLPPFSTAGLSNANDAQIVARIPTCSRSCRPSTGRSTTSTCGWGAWPRITCRRPAWEAPSGASSPIRSSGCATGIGTGTSGSSPVLGWPTSTPRGCPMSSGAPAPYQPPGRRVLLPCRPGCCHRNNNLTVPILIFIISIGATRGVDGGGTGARHGTLPRADEGLS